ncbi:Fatty acyl-CoA hydrolase precursor, medium chain, partial [Orchesella cincta]
MKCIFYIVTALLAVAIRFSNGQPEEVIIDAGELGKIQGSNAWAMAGLNQTGRKYYWFTGIPYADPESYTGDNRFKASKLWDGQLPDIDGDGIFKADERKMIIHCPQKPVVSIGGADVTKLDPFNLIKSYYSRDGISKRRNPSTNAWGKEECLIVTVSTPKLPEGENPEKLPVIFFIHGGGFDAFWGSVFGGQRLLNHDVVLVTMNYRLGVLGSLNLGIEEAPGNGNLYDCITALDWVQKYIHHFGGDPNKVTVSGQSAGGVLATTVFLSPLATGKFHGVIGDSGSAYSVWANQKNPIEETLKVVKLTPCARFLDFTGLPNREQALAIRECMRWLIPDDLINAREEYAVNEHLDARLGYDAFTPQVQLSSLETPALTATPVEIMKKGLQNNVPLMMGATRHDGSFVVLTTFYDYLVANGLDSKVDFIKNDLLPKFLKGVGLEDPSGALTHSFLQTYLGDTANSDDVLSKLPGLLDIHTVLGFKGGAYGLVEAHAKMNPKSYYYAFDYKGLYTTYDIANGASIIPGGIAHVDDLLYLFQLIPLLTAKDWAVSERYVKYWVNFATYGNPNGPGDIDEPFPRYNAADHRFLIINETDKVGYHCRDTWIGNSLELVSQTLARNITTMTTLRFVLAVLCLGTFAKAQEWNYTWAWTPPTLPPEWTDWTPGSEFPTLPPDVTLVPPEWIEDAKVEIPVLGKIQGAVSFTSPVTAPNKRKFYWFAGIPYADPSSYVGQESRFKPSRLWEGPLPTNNNGVFSAINPLIWCPQGDILPLSTDLGDVLTSYKNHSKVKSARMSEGISPQIQGIEACLRVNINTPVNPENGQTAQRLPVIFFIHGGSFDMIWGGIFGGHRFLNRDVVLVTINYRLGILGSLNLGIDDAPGNAAMYDVVTSLKWVKKYIHHFGGDPDKVTVTGHSAGAVMASHLLTSPLSIDDDGKPLVHGIITLSGSALSQWATATDPMTHHLRVAYYTGCYKNNTDESPDLKAIRDCMAGMEIVDLMDAMDKYTDNERWEARLGFDAKVPSLQNPELTIPKFMIETPYAVIEKGEQLDIPLMMGATRHDGTFVMEDTYNKFLEKHNYTTNPIYLRNELIPTLLTALVTLFLLSLFTLLCEGLQDDSGELIHSIAKHYIGEALYADDFESKIPGLIDIHSVFAFKAGSYKMIEMHAKKNPNSYYYSFEYQGLWTVDGGDVIPGGVGHIDSIYYLFQAFPLIVPADQNVAYRFVDYWANFATYGNPNGEGPKTVAAPYNPLNHAYLVIDSFDRTGYYCRDSWVNNSLEIMPTSPTSSPITVGETNNLIDENIYMGRPTIHENNKTDALKKSTIFILVMG